MKRIFFIAALLTTAAFTSCKKENISQSQPTVVPVATNERLLLSASDGNNYTFQYNADKTLKSYNVNGADWICEYPPNKMIMTLFVNNEKKGMIVNDLANGIAKKQTIIYYDANGVITDTYETTYTYNAKGLLAEEHYIKNGQYYGVAYRTYDSNDDMVLFQVKDKNGVLTSNSQYEYDLSLLDKSGSYGQFNSGCMGSIFPRRSKHLAKKQTALTSNVHYYFSYTLDASGYVLTGTMKDDSNAVVNTFSYTWQ